MNWKVVKDSDLSYNDRLSIAKIKDGNWTHGLESQLKWMELNIDSDDRHLMGFDDSGLVCYASLVNVIVTTDDKQKSCIGLGCVCVSSDKHGTGFGTALVNEAGRLVSEENMTGILLCKESLTDFYLRCGWTKVIYNISVVADIVYNHTIMSFNEIKPCREIIINRNF